MRGNKGTNNMADEDIDMENFDERAEIASDFAADDDNEKVKLQIDPLYPSVRGKDYAMISCASFQPEHIEISTSLSMSRFFVRYIN